MKKIHKIALVLAIILAIVTGLTYRTFAVTGKITVETIRLRSKPTTESKIIGMGDMGDTIEILGEEEGWYKVRYKGIEGYAYKDYIQTSGKIEPSEQPKVEEPVASEQPIVSETPAETPVVTPEPSTEPTPEEPQEVSNPNPSIIELGDTLNKDTAAYLLPNYTSVKIAELKQNEQVKIITTLANWAKIESNNKESWIPKTLLMKDTTQTSSEPVVEQPTSGESQALNEAAYISSNTGVNLRQGPSTETEAIGKLTPRTKITIIAEENDWYKVTFNDKEGYVAKRLVTKGEPPAVTEDVSSRSASSRSAQAEVAPSVPAAPASAGAVSAASIAQNYVGCSYVYGGASPDGFDCSGFTSYCYAQAGISLGRTTYAQASQGTAVSKSELQAGDLIVFRGTNHVGIYVGNGQFIHASNPNTGVVYDSINYGYWANQYQSARRF